MLYPPNSPTVVQFQSGLSFTKQGYVRLPTNFGNYVREKSTVMDCVTFGGGVAHVESTYSCLGHDITIFVKDGRCDHINTEGNDSPTNTVYLQHYSLDMARA